VCCITALGPISRKRANTRSERDQLRIPGAEPPLAAGLHYTLYYTQLLTQTEHLSFVGNRNPPLDSYRPRITTQLGRPQCKRHPTDYNSTCNSVVICPNATTNRSAGSRKSATCRYKIQCSPRGTIDEPGVLS
jgi:hypothetical protein